MASWTGNGSWVSSYVGTLTAVEDSYSIDDNSSVVKVSLLLENNSYNYFRGYTCTGSISIDGSVVKSVSFTGYMEPNRSAQYHSLEFITDEPITIAHNADGTKTISVSATMTTKTGYGSDNSKIGAGTINITGGNLVLTNIPRASTLSAPNIQIGSSGTLTVTKAVSAHVNTITWACAGLTGTVATKSSATSISFTPPTTLYARIPNATEASITYTITTYASSSATTALGSNTATAKVTVGSSIKPTAPSITLSPVNTNTWLNTKGYYVSGYTKLKVAATASAGSGATLNALAASVAGQSGSFNSGSNWTTPNVISSTGAVTATVTATDSRGRSASNTASVTFQSYSAPSITTLTAERGTYSGSTWTSDPSGAHIRVTYAVELTLSGNTPSVTVACTGQTSQTATTTTGTKYFTGTTQSSAYTITLTVTDSVGVTATKTTSVSTISVPFNFNTNLPAMGLGKLAESANWLDSAWNIGVCKPGTTEAVVRARNDHGWVNLDIASNNNRGIWDSQTSSWMIYRATNGGVGISAAEGIGIGGNPPTDGWTNMYQNIRFGNNTTPTQTRYYATNGYVNLKADTSVSAARTITLPDKSGTLAVVESGTNGSWYYEKWGNGKIEAVFSGSVTYSSMSASGQLYRSTNNAVAIPSGIFSATPQRTEITINNAATVVVCATAKASSATNVNVQIWRSTNATSSIDCTIRCTYIP